MSSERVIALIDMDCFYVQCEQRLAPTLWSHPCAVAQYNSWKGGGLIAVNYEARGYGVKRGMRGNDAMAVCPDIHIFSVPEVRGKADLSRYREASEEVFEAIIQLVTTLDSNIIVEKASIDEAYIDLTQYIDVLVDRSEPLPRADQLSDTKIEVNDENDLSKWLNDINENPYAFRNEIRLVLAAIVVQQIRKEILDKTQFKCSAGISHNKTVAKLGCGLNKPNAQTILPMSGFDRVFIRTDISSVRSLGGKLGTNVKNILKISNMFELKCIDYKELAKHFDAKTAKWLKDMANGSDDEPVTNRQVSKSLGCGKNFPGKTALSTLEDIKFWVRQLSEELVERITRDKRVNKRSPKLLSVGFRLNEKDWRIGNTSRSLPLDSNCTAQQLENQIIRDVFNKMKTQPIYSLSISASKFVEFVDDPSHNSVKLDTYFKKVDKRPDICEVEPQSERSPSKTLKSVHTKTLNDYWKASTSRDKSTLYNESDAESNVANEEIEVLEVSRIENSNHCKNSSFVATMETNGISNEIETNSKSSDESIAEAIHEPKECLPLNGVTTEDLELSFPTKRGFFYRKMLQLKAEEKADQQKRILERIDAKNRNDVKRKRTECVRTGGPVIDISD